MTSAGYAHVIRALRHAYAQSAGVRDKTQKNAWKIDERDAFLHRLKDEAKQRILEIGAGTGQDSAFFSDNGLNVVATDLTPEMVGFCRAKGLDARVMDVLHLGFPRESFDAIWTINTLLHVPNADLPDALAEIHRVLRSDGLLYVGVFGGLEVGEGVWDNDRHDPKRFFSFRTPDQLESFVRERFDVVDFHVLDLETPGSPGGFTFQSVTARRL